MNQTKLRAFTILEIIIAMLISAILVGMTYTAYTIISKSYLDFIIKNKQMETAIQLDRLLKKDFYSAKKISRDNDGIQLQTDSIPVTYVFNPDFITRTQLITDTFKVRMVTWSTSFESRPLGDIFPQDEQNQLDDLELHIIVQNEKIPYHYHKQYSSVNLFQEDPDAIH